MFNKSCLENNCMNTKYKMENSLSEKLLEDNKKSKEEKFRDKILNSTSTSEGNLVVEENMKFISNKTFKFGN